LGVDVIDIIDVVARETMLFAAVGLLIGGIDDLVIDAVFFTHRLVNRSSGRMAKADLPAPECPGRLALFVPAWDEAAVIGQMLTAALSRLDHADYRIYVGVYANDAATTAAANAVAVRDARVRVVVGTKPGPTTKADCLNTLWHALIAADLADACATRAVIIHDAEDVVHPDELRVIDALLDTNEVVQLPVLPLIQPDARLVAGHYADEFAESHTRLLVVRTALGAAMPLAGTGCAIAKDVLARVAVERGGDPFDAASLVEDYELGLRLAASGARGIFARVADGDTVVAVRSYFPSTLGTAVRQKARWMTGIALAGWDRTGWAARPMALADHWMRFRDRRAPLAMVVLASAYLAAVLWGISIVWHAWWETAPRIDIGGADWLLLVNAALLGWRLVMRMAFTGRLYGMMEAFWSIPRFVIGNAVTLAAAPRALGTYVRLLAGRQPAWDKTAHVFPDLVEPAR
jgi:adsorption protein B